MIRSTLLVSLFTLLSPLCQAAVLVTSEHAGDVSQQYFEQGEFVLIQGGRPSFGIDRDGNCWFIDGGQLVLDSCDQMLQSVSDMRDQALAGLGAEERAMVAQMMGGRQAAAPLEVTAIGGRTIAGYDAECHALGSTREICVSPQLMREIQQEMGDRRFVEMFERFGQSAARMGGVDPQLEAATRLMQRGYPMLDLQKAPALPGMNGAMLQYLPEAQRAQIMQQMGAGGQGQVRGSTVIAVDRGAAMPSIDLSRYQRVGFEQFMQQQMGLPGGMPRRR